MVLAGGHDVGLAVERSAGGAENDLAHAVVGGSLQDVEAADEVHLRVIAGVGHRAWDLGLRRVVVDDLRLERGDRALHLVLVADVDPVDLRLGAQVFLAAGAEVVEHCHLVAGRDIGVDDVRADETGAASDENLHRS